MRVPNYLFIAYQKTVSSSSPSEGTVITIRATNITQEQSAILMHAVCTFSQSVHCVRRDVHTDWMNRHFLFFDW